MVVLTDLPADVLTMIGKQLLPNIIDLIRFSGTNKAIYQFYDSGFWRDVCTAAGYSIAESGTGRADGNYRNLAISLVKDALKTCHPARLRYNDDKRIIRYFLFYDLLDWDYLDLPQLRFNGIGTQTFCCDIRFQDDKFSLFIAKKYASGEYYAKHFVNILDRPLFKYRLVSTASTQRLLYNDLKSTPAEIEILNVNGVVVEDVLNAIKGKWVTRSADSFSSIEMLSTCAHSVSYWDAKFIAWDNDHIDMPENEKADDRNGYVSRT